MIMYDDQLLLAVRSLVSCEQHARAAVSHLPEGVVRQRLEGFLRSVSQTREFVELVRVKAAMPHIASNLDWVP